MRELKSRNRPQRERLACFHAAISVVKEVQLTVETSAGTMILHDAQVSGKQKNLPI
jgi:hypothetical protein